MSKKEVVGAINNCKWLTLSERRILIGLWSFWTKSKLIYARQKYFAENWNVGYSTVRRGLRKLHNWGIIDIEERIGTSNLIEFNYDEKELIHVLEQKEPPTRVNKRCDDNSEQLGDKNEHSNLQTEQGGVLNSSIHNTVIDTYLDKEEDIANNTEEDTQVLNDNSDSLSNPSIDIGDITYADEIDDDVKHFQELWTEHSSDVFKAFTAFQSDTNRMVVLLMDKADNSNPFNIHIGNKTIVATQTKFDRSKYLVLDSNDFKEIISCYE